MAEENITRLLQSVHDKVRDLLEMDRFYVALYDRRRGRLSFPLVLEHQDDETVPLSWAERPFQPFEPPPGDGVEILWPDWVIAQGKPVLCEQDLLSKLESGSAKYWPEDGPPPLSWLGIPLASEAQSLGALVVENRRQAGVFGPRVGLLTTVARQAAIALANARLRDRLERQIANLNALYEMGQELTASIQLSEQQIVEMIYKWASRVMDTKNMYIALYDEAIDEVRFALAYRDDRRVDVETEKGWGPRRAGQGRTEWIIRHRQPLLDETRAESEAWYREPGRQEYIGQPFASWVGVPMIARDKVLGVIATYHATEEYVYDENDVQVLTMLAAQAAVAIENARLYANMEQMVEERTRAWLQAREQAEAAEKLALMSQVAAEFAHRMNNLAGTIPVRVEMAREKLDPQNARDARVIRQLDSIASDAKLLLDAAQEIKRTTETRAPEFVDVNAELEIARGRVWLSKPEVEDRIRVEMNLADGLPRLYVERNKLVDTLTSIIQNGVEAMPGGGTLTLTTRQGAIGNKPCIEIAVSDTGVGISPDHLPKIFDLFFTTKEKGLGFGLWRDRVFIKNLGGDIEVSSQVGEGTTFTVRIPVTVESSPTLSSEGGQND